MTQPTTAATRRAATLGHHQRLLLLVLLGSAQWIAPTTAFTTTKQGRQSRTNRALAAVVDRRWMIHCGWVYAAATILHPPPTHAAPPTTEPLRTFVDPQGLFQITVPQRYFCIRRTARGDLPDTQTGNGRRGSSIFSSGDMAKAQGTCSLLRLWAFVG